VKDRTRNLKESSVYLHSAMTETPFHKQIIFKLELHCSGKLSFNILLRCSLTL